MRKRKTFLVESYLPRARAGELDDTMALLRAHRVDPADAAPVAYLRSFYVPEDEVCYHLFRAASAADVRRVAIEVAIPVDHIGEAEQHVAGPGRRRDDLG